MLLEDRIFAEEPGKEYKKMVCPFYFKLYNFNNTVDYPKFRKNALLKTSFLHERFGGEFMSIAITV